MDRVYLDNAATTPLDPEVFEVMKPVLLEKFGNPSSIHSHGREVRSLIERSRKKVADLLGVSPAEIFFTSGGTESDNHVLHQSVVNLGVKRIITSRIEHHAVLHTVESLAHHGMVKVEFVRLDEKGVVDIGHFESLLQTNEPTLVSLMHANNEIGNLINLYEIGMLCRQYNAWFHSDTVQTMGHLPHDLSKTPVDFVVGSAHKFHGPKGIGFLYVRHGTALKPFLHGGAQERNMRGGTENVSGIVGLAKALELACHHMDEHHRHIVSLKQQMIHRLTDAIPDVHFNGLSGELDKSLYTVLNVCLPPTDFNEMLLFNLDIAGVSASGGSACSSGSSIGSHVLAQLTRDQNRGAVRFSFSRFNTKADVDFAAEKLASLLTVGV